VSSLRIFISFLLIFTLCACQFFRKKPAMVDMSKTRVTRVDKGKIIRMDTKPKKATPVVTTPP
jgi:hypothetical protein